MQRALLGILTILLLALAPAAGASPVGGPGELPPAPGPVSNCTPTKGVVCGPGKPPLLRSALTRYESTLRSNVVRRGLGLPSLRQLFGKAGARAETLADARLAKRGDVRSATAASTAGSAALHHVGSVGRVSVDATVAPGIGSGVDQISYIDRIKGPHGSQTRSIRFTATADACPQAAKGGDNVGQDTGHLLAAEHIVTVERTGHLEITTDFSFDMTGSREIWGLVNGNADLTQIMPNPKPTAYARVRRVRVARDVRTGRRFRERPLELNYELHMISPLWMDGSEFNDFVEKYGDANDHDRADAAVPDRLLNTAAYESAARTFMSAVEAKTRSVYASAEAQWKTPNRCVQVQSDAPAQLVPGQSIKVHVSATSKRGDPPANLRAYAHYQPFRSAGLAVDPFKVVAPDENAAHDFTVTPPAKAWPDTSPERLQIMFYSTGGVGEASNDFRAQTLPIHYRVLSASLTTRVQSSQAGGLCSPLGGTSGWSEDTGTLTGASQDNVNSTLDALTPSGPLSGAIYAAVPWKQSGDINGCDFATPGGLEPCSRSWSNVALPNPITVGFDIWVQNRDASQARVHWMQFGYGVGDSIPTCDVQIWANLPYDTSTQTVPLAKLLSTGQQTFTFGGSIHLDHDLLGKPASIDYRWSYSVTVERR